MNYNLLEQQRDCSSTPLTDLSADRSRPLKCAAAAISDAEASPCPNISPISELHNKPSWFPHRVHYRKYPPETNSFCQWLVLARVSQRFHGYQKHLVEIQLTEIKLEHPVLVFSKITNSSDSVCSHE